MYRTSAGSRADLMGRLVDATEKARGGVLPETPAAMRDELVRLRRACDLLELRFSVVASAFAATPEREWQGCVSPIQWLRLECGMTAGAAWKAICVGDQAPALTQSVEAVDTGKLGFAHLAVLAGTARALRESPTAAGFDERPLVAQALAHPLARFRDDRARVRHANDEQAFRIEQAQDAEFRTLDVRTGEDRTTFMNGWVDRVGGATIRAALDPMARRTGSADLRSRYQHHADALVELAEHCLETRRARTVGGQRPHLQVTTSLATLSGTPGSPAGVLEGAGPISAATVQRLACDASVRRVVLGPDSAVLDVGRARRLPSTGTRQTLRARDRGCAWPGCDRLVTWTAAHHLTHWASGGATELDNLVHR